MVWKRRAIGLGLLLVGAPALIWAFGVAFWLGLGVVGLALVAILLPGSADRRTHVGMVVGSVFVGLALLEAGLWLAEWVASAPIPEFVAAPGRLPVPPALPPEIRIKIERMQDALIMPPAWRKRDLAKIPGTDPFVWHGVLHQIDANGMRRDAPFAPRDPRRFRIVAVGDSLTYGEGVDAYWAYPAQLERALATEFRVEVLNLGVRGYASEDVLNTVRRFVPALHPDLVIYGVCLNDFLDSGEQQQGPPSLLPPKLMKILTRRSRVVRLLEERFDALMRRLGLQPDFYADLLTEPDRRYRRFAADVAAMNAAVTGWGLPPMLAMVLDQGPRWDGPGRQLALVAERRLRAAGIETVASEDFYRRYDGRNFRVSRWEGHPNEEAHATWASELAAAVRQRPELAPFRKVADVARHGPP